MSPPSSNVATTAKPVFRFHRYRAELARRQQQIEQSEDGGLSDQHVDNGETNGGGADSDEVTSTKDEDEQIDIASQAASPASSSCSCVENLSHAVVTISQDRTITIIPKDWVLLQQLPGISGEGATESNDQNAAKSHPQQQTLDVDRALLLRHLENCEVVIDILALPALHIVDIRHCSIKVKGTITSAVHVTQAVQFSSLYLQNPAQQLRIHQVHNFTVYLGVVPETEAMPVAGGAVSLPSPITTTKPAKKWNKGSIILEDSKHVTFVVPPSDLPSTSTVDVGEIDNGDASTSKEEWMHTIIKDFGWLRTGVPSPNFVVQEHQQQSVVGDAATQEVKKSQDAQATKTPAATTGVTMNAEESDDDEDEL